MPDGDRDMRDQKSPPIPTSFPLALMSWAAMVLFAAFGVAAAEENRGTSGMPAVQKTLKPEVAPRGQRTVRDIRYGDWRKVCFKPPGSNMVCRTTISGAWDTGQFAVRADVIERQGDATPRLQLFLPIGLYLQAGVKLRVDQGQQYQIPFVWCLSNTCIAADPIGQSLAREMETGQTLLLEVVDSNVLAVSTSLPLDRFAATRNGAPAETYQQDLDE
jgi:invasion protein IalB